TRARSAARLSPRFPPAPRSSRRRSPHPGRRQTMTEYAARIPISIVALSAIAAMVAEAIRRPGERMPIAGFGLIGSAGAALASVFLSDSDALSLGVIRSDNFALSTTIVIYTIGLLTMFFSHEIAEREGIPA